MRKALTLYGYGKSKISSKVYKRTPKGCPPFDIIRLTCIHEEGDKIEDLFVYPQEAMMIATALMKAWMVTFEQGMQNINPNNYKFYKPFQELESAEKTEKESGE